MMLFWIWIWMVINEALWILCIIPNFISEYFNLERGFLVQNLTTWVKFTLALIYNQFSWTSYTQKIMLFESWTRMVINKVLWIIFTYSFLLLEIINFNYYHFQNRTTWVNSHYYCLDLVVWNQRIGDEMVEIDPDSTLL